MDKKSFIRKRFKLRRKKKYFEVSEKFFYPLKNIILQRHKNKKINISIYFPSSFEVNVLKILNIEYFKKYTFSLPRIHKNNLMSFYKWKKKDILCLNKFGIPEPLKSNKIVPAVILIPLLAYDKNKNRIGYGKGFYDKFLKKYLRTFNKILTVGVAFSFQKYNNLPVNNNDVKLDFVITEKGII